MFGRFRKRKKKQQYNWHKSTIFKGKATKGGNSYSAYIISYYVYTVILVSGESKFVPVKIKLETQLMVSSKTDGNTRIIEKTWIMNATKPAVRECLLKIADWFIANKLPAGKAQDIIAEAVHYIQLDV